MNLQLLRWEDILGFAAIVGFSMVASAFGTLFG